jgi:hypothetical protein
MYAKYIESGGGKLTVEVVLEMVVCVRSSPKIEFHRLLRTTYGGGEGGFPKNDFRIGKPRLKI